MLSHGATPCPELLGKGENVGLLGACDGCGIELHGQASPRGTPLIAVRDAGQIGARPSISTFQSVGMGTISALDACVDGCERRWSSMLPGLPSSPKNSFFWSRASPNRTNSWVRPSNPDIWLPGPDCRPWASCSTLSCRSASLSTWYLLSLLLENSP